MKAIFFQQHGGPEVWQFGDLERPVPEAGQTLIRVRAVALNHLDIWVRRGWPGLKLAMPHVGGCDIVGDVVLNNGESALAIGDRTYVYPGINPVTDKWTARGEDSVSPSYRIIGEHLAGGLAEYVVVPTANLLPAPKDLGDESLCARLLTGLTCWRMIIVRGGLKPGESVLVVGAGGGVNSLAIQMARALGAHVIALAGTDNKCRRAKELGAAEVINYRENPEWARQVQKLNGGKGVDLVVDNVGKDTITQSLRSLQWGGRLVTVGNTSGYEMQIDNRLIFGKQLSIIGSTMGSRQDFSDMLAFLQQHNIHPVIDAVDRLENGIMQLARLEAGEQFGKIVLKP